MFYLAAAFSLSILVVFGLIYLEKSKDDVFYVDAVEHTYKVLSAITICEKNLIEAETSQRGYLLTRENIFKEEFEYVLPSVNSALKVIGELTIDNSKQKTFYLQLTKYVAAKIVIMKDNLEIKAGDPMFVQSLRQGAFVMDNCKYYMKKMREGEEGLLQERLVTKNKYQRLNRSFFRATFITACLICLIAVIVFFRELSIRLLTQRNLRAKINELSANKKELEEITFAASHDLQEPMRKVRILSSLMIKRFTGTIPDADLEVLHRIYGVTEQMHGRLNDLVLYTNLLDPNEKYSKVNLYDIFKIAYHKVFGKDDVHFKVSTQLPVINGSQGQLLIMLIHLLENSAKFKTPGTELTIEVNYELTKAKASRQFPGQVPQEQYHQVTVSDNGIGFDNQYKEKIFVLFQRLHTPAEYPGKGVGLSIARRVMANHQGFIFSSGEKNKGATFILLFPAT